MKDILLVLCSGAGRLNVLCVLWCAVLCADPGARTSDPSLQDAALQAAAALGRPLFSLFSHPAARVADGTAVIMRAIAERGAAAAAAPMRDAALREGAVLQHLQLALFATGAWGWGLQPVKHCCAAVMVMLPFTHFCSAAGRLMSDMWQCCSCDDVQQRQQEQERPVA